MNNLNVVGRLTKDAELHFIKSTGVPVLKFYVAVDRKYQKDKNNKKTDFIPCEFIGKQCENLAKYMEKGILVNIIGEIHFENYKTKQGEQRTFTKMHVENLNILEFKKVPNEKGKTFDPIEDDNIPF